MLTKTVAFDGLSFQVCGTEDDLYFRNVEGHAQNNRPYSYALRSLDPGSIILDIGANIGVTTMLAALIVPDSRVVAVEASPTVRRYLEATVAANSLQGRVSVVPAAVGAAPGMVPFYEAHGALSGSHMADQQEGYDVERIAVQVPMTTVDNLAADLPRLDLIKIDVEGYEPDVLRGAEQTLDRHKPLVVMEFNSWCLTAFRNTSPRALLDQVRETFGTMLHVADGHLRTAVTPEDYSKALFYNLIRHGCVDDFYFSPDAGRLERLEAAWEAPPGEAPALQTVLSIGRPQTQAAS